MKRLIATCLMAMILLGVVPATIVNAEEIPDVTTEEKANDVNAPPVEFEGTLELNQIVKEIEYFYLQLNHNGRLSRAAPGTKWGNGEVVWNGGNGYIISYFWVRGSDMVSWNIVGKAQRNAVIATYGSVNPNTSYKMKTQQFLVKTPKWQTQGYITTSERAWCYGRD